MPPGACPYDAVGMQRASHSAIGLPSRSSIASLMLGFLMPADVRRNFTLPPGVGTADENVLRPTDPYMVRPADESKLIGSGLAPASRPRGHSGTLAQASAVTRDGSCDCLIAAGLTGSNRDESFRGFQSV